VNKNVASNRRLVCALACRNHGSRLYGKPLQNLDVERGVSILDNIIQCLKSIDCIDEIVLGISEGSENEIFRSQAEKYDLKAIVGDQKDVLSRLIECGRVADATDIFRVTSESPFMYFEAVETLWAQHVAGRADATFLDNIIDGCNFEILSLAALETSHRKGDDKHRSELCTLYIREHPDDFDIQRNDPPQQLIRRDLRLTVDTPEDLVVCRAVYDQFRSQAPRIPVASIVEFLDRNPSLIELTAPFAEQGYKTMYL